MLPDLGVIVLQGQTPAEGLVLPPDFARTVATFAADVARRLSLTRHCIFRSADEAVTRRLGRATDLPERPEDIPEMRRGEVGQIRLRQTLDLPGLDAIVAALVPQIERRVFHAPVVVEKATVYRNIPSVLPEFSAILWHSDNHFEGVVKIMVYLTDVTEDTAPFEYLRHNTTRRPIHVAPHWPQRFPYGRVPQEVVDGHLREGYETHKATGAQGTVLLFDDKIVHKGNYAHRGHRDALVLQLRPTWRTGLPYLSPRWTSPL